MLDEPLSRSFATGTLKALTDGLGLSTVEDLLRHYPRRYAERGELTDLAALQLDEQVTVLARVDRATARPMRNRRGNLLEVIVTDGHGELTLTFFGQAWRERELKPGRVGLFAGKVGAYRGKRQLAHPDYELLGDGDLLDADLPVGSPAEGDDLLALDAVAAFAGALIPLYPATAALPSWKVAQCVRTVLDPLGDVPDPLPDDVRAAEDLPALGAAFRLIHQPSEATEHKRAMRRFRFEEAFILQVLLAQRRAAAAALVATPRPAADGDDSLLRAFDARLPFELTDGQRELGSTLAADLAQPRPMNRLLQGEVGSGKTVVALRAMLQVVDAGGQAVLLAPTEVLAQQHHRSISAMLGPLGERGMLGGADVSTGVVLLTGSASAAERRRVLLDIASGDAGIVIGTHALLEGAVQFQDLGIVVVDEQHRFGVEQRDALRAKGRSAPHVLVMTATPIPRTVAMTVFGDLEVSTLRELPRGRSAIATHVVPVADRPHHLTRAWERVREEVAAGRQAFVVCPRIGADSVNDADDADGLDEAPDDDGSPSRPPLAVIDVHDELAAGALAGLRVEMLHGRMTSDAKDTAMRRFAAGEVDVLVATTVIEVGVDVPNATVMVVLDADRFGVSQLHQLRGRVGRGGHAGLCLLVTDAPADTPARERLDAVAATGDGFELSRIDLEQRREGDVLGAAQSGRRNSLRLLRVLTDEKLIVRARDHARALVDADPALAAHPVLAAQVDELQAEDRAEFVEKS